MADADYAAYFLGSPSSVAQIETLEINHPAFSRVFRVQHTVTAGVAAGLETGGGVWWDYYPLQIRRLAARANLDTGLSVTLGDLGDVIPAEMERVRLSSFARVAPTVRFRTYRSDDLSRPLYGPLTLEAGPISTKREGATFEARAPRLALGRTGECYTFDRFPALRGTL